MRKNCGGRAVFHARPLSLPDCAATTARAAAPSAPATPHTSQCAPAPLCPPHSPQECPTSSDDGPRSALDGGREVGAGRADDVLECLLRAVLDAPAQLAAGLGAV